MIIYDESGAGSGAGMGDDYATCPQCKGTLFIPENGKTVCDACEAENTRDEAADERYRDSVGD